MCEEPSLYGNFYFNNVLWFSRKKWKCAEHAFYANFYFNDVLCFPKKWMRGRTESRISKKKEKMFGIWGLEVGKRNKKWKLFSLFFSHKIHGDQLGLRGVNTNDYLFFPWKILKTFLFLDNNNTFNSNFELSNIITKEETRKIMYDIKSND